MFCTNCGTEAAAGAKFCGQCGSAMSTSQTEAPGFESAPEGVSQSAPEGVSQPAPDGVSQPEPEAEPATVTPPPFPAPPSNAVIVPVPEQVSEEGNEVPPAPAQELGSEPALPPEPAHPPVTDSIAVQPAASYTGMKVGEAVGTVLRNFATIRGRASRSEFWLWTLAIWIVMIVSLFLTYTGDEPNFINIGAALIIVLVAFGGLIPSICVGIRRLHDSGKPGALILLNLIPYVGGVVVLVLCALPPTAGPNRYGEQPVAKNQ